MTNKTIKETAPNKLEYSSLETTTIARQSARTRPEIRNEYDYEKKVKDTRLLSFLLKSVQRR